MLTADHLINLYKEHGWNWWEGEYAFVNEDDSDCFCAVGAVAASLLLDKQRPGEALSTTVNRHHPPAVVRAAFDTENFDAFLDGLIGGNDGTNDADTSRDWVAEFYGYDDENDVLDDVHAAFVRGAMVGVEVRRVMNDEGF